MKAVIHYIFAGVLAIILAGCESVSGPDLSGEIVLSSETFGSDGFFIYGYSYEESEMYRFPFAGETVPDIINEGFRAIVEGELVSLPGFNTPGQMNGFALSGEFGSAEEALEYYRNYGEVEDGLQFEVLSDTVKLHQVWVQRTAAGNYVKLLVTNISMVGGGEGSAVNNEVSLSFTYQPDGSTQFGE